MASFTACQTAAPKHMRALSSRTAAPAPLAAIARRPQRKIAFRVSAVAGAPKAIPAQYTEMTPSGVRILVKCGETKKETVGGVLLPESAAEKSTTGEVVSVGSKCTQLKGSETVFYSKFGLGATSLEFKGAEYLLMKEEDAIGVLAGGGDIPNLQPIADRVLVKPLKVADSSTGGVLLPESAKDKPMMGEVISCGPGSTEKPIKVKAGDKVVYFKYAGDKMKAGDGSMYVVLRQQDIFGTLK